MSFIGGYQSNFNLSNLHVVGDFPVDHMIGGFGIATGVNDYAVALNTAIANYRKGLLLELVFAEANTGPVQINVSGCGLKPLKKHLQGNLSDLDPGDITTSKVYLVVYDGQGFQMVNAASAGGAIVADATEVQKGIARVATQPEVNTGEDDSEFITPLKLAGFMNLVLRFTAGQAAGSIVPRIGFNNEASGIYSAVRSGQNNQASGPYSVAHGLYAAAVLYNEWAKSGGSLFNVRGSSQCSILNLMTIVPPIPGSVALTPDGGHSGENRWTVSKNTVQQFKMQLTIVQNAGDSGAPGLTWTGVYEGAIRNQEGPVHWVGAPPIPKDIHQDPGFNPVSGFSFTSDEIVPFVNGISERSLHVNATVYITQTKYGLI